MTSYWRPRWPNRVLFGSHRDLKYRIDIKTKGGSLFRLSTHSGPGFELTLFRSDGEKGFDTEGLVPLSARKHWLDVPGCRSSISLLLGLHFSSIEARINTIHCFCIPENNDVLPEGTQLDWLLSQLYVVWSAVPEEERVCMNTARFME